MADFKTKIFTLAGAATMFAGMAFGQATITGNGALSATPGFIRAEGTTEMLPSTTVTLSNSVAAGSVTLTVYLSPTVAITSETDSNKNLELTATSDAAPASPVYGTVSGSTVTFSGITTGAATTVITISNIRVNASTLPVSNGVPTAISELIFLSGAAANAVPGSAGPLTVAYVQNGLGAISIPTGNNPGAAISNQICSAVSGSTLQYTVNIPENFSNAFKTQTQESGTDANAPATSGTRLAITLGNIPANVSVYLPLTVNTNSTNGTGTLTLITSATAKTAGSNNVSPAGTSAPLNGYGAVTIANGTGTAYYELTAGSASGVLENYPVNVYYVSKAAAVAAPATAATASVSFAPTGSSNYPNFVVGSSTTTLTGGSTYIACSTTLLFPFVTNQLGFDTGIAISNTSTDTLGSGKTPSAAAPQSGTCSLAFFGNTAPAAVTTANIATGTTYAAAASSLAPGFQGYMIANCNFLYGHGFAYVVYNLTQNNGAAMGYLADAITSTRQSTVVSVSGVGSNAPEE